MDFSCLMAAMQAAAAKKKKSTPTNKKGRDSADPSVLTSIENVLVPLLTSILVFLLTSVERLVDELFYKHLEAIHRIVDGIPPDVFAQAQSTLKGGCASDSDTDEDGDERGSDCVGGGHDRPAHEPAGVPDVQAAKRLSGSQRAVSRGGKTPTAFGSGVSDREGSFQGSPGRKRISRFTQSPVPTAPGRGQVKQTGSRTHSTFTQSATMSPSSPPPPPTPPPTTAPAPASRKRRQGESEKPVAIKSHPPHRSSGDLSSSSSFFEESRGRDVVVSSAKNEEYDNLPHTMNPTEEASQSLIPEMDM